MGHHKDGSIKTSAVLTRGKLTFTLTGVWLKGHFGGEESERTNELDVKGFRVNFCNSKTFQSTKKELQG